MDYASVLSCRGWGYATELKGGGEGFCGGRTRGAEGKSRGSEGSKEWNLGGMAGGNFQFVEIGP